MNRIDGMGAPGAGRTTHGQAAGGIDGAAGPAAEGAARSDGKQDTASLSSRGRVMAGIFATVAQSPEVRAERVAALRAAINGGTYEIDVNAIAARLAPSMTTG